MAWVCPEYGTPAVMVTEVTEVTEAVKRSRDVKSNLLLPPILYSGYVTWWFLASVGKLPLVAAQQLALCCGWAG